MENHLLISSLVYFCVSLGGMLLCLLFARIILRNTFRTREIEQSGNQKLAPCEIAYLLRGGDVTHTLLVLAVDLLHRRLKNISQDNAELASYEQNMWKIVTRSIKDWALQKTQENVLAGAKTPLQISKRAFFLYNFVRKSLKSIIGDTIADPRRLKRYFAPSGLIRILTDFTSAGYKQAFQIELKKDLLARGLLVGEEQRKRIGKYFFLISIFSLALSIVPILFFTKLGFAEALIIVLSAILGASSARIILSFKELLPLYQELVIVAENVNRSGLRFNLLKLILYSINVIFWFAPVFVSCVCIALGFGILTITGHTTNLYLLVYFLSLTISYFVIFDFAFEGWKLQIEERPTPEAEEQLDLLQKTFAKASPLDSFKSALSSQDYDPTFSQLLALYGIETLLVLF